MTYSNSDLSKSTYFIIIAVILGGFFGHFAPEIAVKLKIAGDIFLNILFVLVIPLIISSMISGISGLGDIRHLGSLGLKTILFYLSTTFLAVLTGIILVNIISPGRNVTIIRSEFPMTGYSIIQMPISGGSILSLHFDKEHLPSNIQPQRHNVELLIKN